MTSSDDMSMTSLVVVV